LRSLAIVTHFKCEAEHPFHPGLYLTAETRSGGTGHLENSLVISSIRSFRVSKFIYNIGGKRTFFFKNIWVFIISNEQIIKRLIKESSDERSSRYMFFSNLQQMRRQCDLLLDLDRNMIESILENGHDWAQDHIAEAKNNMDQVFDFLMNESKSEGMELSMNIDDKDMVMMEGRKKTGTKLCARGKSAAKARYDVFPSAYSNGHGVQVCKGKIKGLDGKKRCSPPYC
jgi:hypothetical protein